jgi:hypothetical protein
VSILVALAVVASWAIAGGLPPTGSPAEGTAPLRSVATTPSPTTVPSPSASPSGTPIVVDRALSALDEVDAAIAATTGSGGLTGKERNELKDRAGDVRAALETRDLDEARKAAEALVDRIGELDDELAEVHARRLSDAVAALLDILGGDR